MNSVKLQDKKNILSKISCILYQKQSIQKENQENNPIYDTFKNNKILKNEFNQEVNALYTENYKTMMKENEDANKWKDIFMDWRN